MNEKIEHLKIIKNAEVYTPEYFGKKDILIAADKIAYIGTDIQINKDVKTIDAAGKILIPGLIDNHVHILGGGGEGGYQNRTPEIVLTDITTAGITTVVGCIGTDGVTRTLSNLVAKAKALDEEGISCFCYTGSYHIPLRTLMGSIQEDIIFIDKIIGVGEVALSDHRSSQPTVNEIAKIAADARIGGILAQKAGLVVVHMGSGKSQLKIIEEIVERTEIPPTQFLPTHVGRDPKLFKNAIRFAKMGGHIDLTTSTPKMIKPDKLTKTSTAFKKLLEAGVPVENISFSSDGQGSLPKFNERGEFIGLKVGSIKTLFDAFRDVVLEEKIPLEKALQVVTSNPAKFLKFGNKGSIQVGKDADIVLLDKDELNVNTVIAKGQIMIEDKKVLVKGTFEN